uniref:Uncharacterized protein n=1 Tax=Colobus angolensis palliatus TaxID=336983 RepID=A0A2K5H8Y0_COLAP
MEFQNIYIQLLVFLFHCDYCENAVIGVVCECLSASDASGHAVGPPRSCLVLVPWTPRACGQAAPRRGHVASDHKSRASLAQTLQLPAPPGFANGIHSDSKGGIGLDVLGMSQPVPTLYVNV